MYSNEKTGMRLIFFHAIHSYTITSKEIGNALIAANTGIAAKSERSPVMCYMLIGGRNVFKDGLMLGGHNDDLCGNEASQIKVIPHGFYRKGDIISLPTGPQIPVIRDTARCLLLKMYIGDNAGDTVAVNEHNVSLMGGEDLLCDRNDRAEVLDPLVPDGCGGGNRIAALLQSSSARECISLIGKYYSEYGNCYPCSIGISDEKESWYMESGGGSTWVAIRVPDDCYLVQSNSYRIHEVDLDDTENVIHSANLKEFLTEKGVWQPEDGPFRWAETFGGKFREKSETYYYNSRRLWSAIRLLTPSADLRPDEEVYPLFLKPDHLIDHQMIMRVLRCCNEDNEFNAFPAEGGVSNHRPIAVPSCIHSTVIELQPGNPANLGAVLWGCVASQLAAPYVPHYFGASEFSREYLNEASFCTNDSAFWRMRKLTNLVMINFREYSPIVAEKWQEYETMAFLMKESADQYAEKLYAENPEAAGKYLTFFVKLMEDEAIKTAEELECTLHQQISGNLFKYFAKGDIPY